MSTDNSNKKLKKKRKFGAKSILSTFIVLFLLLGVTAGGIIFAVLKNTSPIDPSNIQNMLDDSSFIYDKDGNLIEKVHSDSFRSVVSIETMPKDLQNAFIAIEDERFYKHHGVDPKRIIGAVIYDLKTMSKAQGASTITQQLAKNIYLTHEKTYTRKIKDMYYALELERYLTKDQILEMYLNTIYLGRGATGAQAAAQTYFSKDVSELNVAECAIIAGITKNPSRYSPFTTEKIASGESLDNIQLIFYPNSTKAESIPAEESALFSQMLSKGLIDKFQYDQLNKGEIVVRKAVLNPSSVERQLTVLGKMLELGFISQEQYDEAKSYPIEIKIGSKSASGISSYFGDLVKKQVLQELITEKGFSEDEARDTLYKGGLRIYSTMDMNMQKIVEKEFENPANFPGSFKDSSGTVQPQASMVIMDPKNGEVRALVGGRMIGGTKIFNRAINPRQPGSAIKPLAAYLPALDKGMTAATIIDDSPHYDDKGNLWPRNYDRKYGGPSTMRALLTRSSNVGTVKLAEMLSTSKAQSVKTMISYLEKLGISTIVKSKDNPSINDENFSLSMGGMSKGVTNLELTAAYGAIANSGVHNEPIFFTRAETANGDVLLENKPKTRKVVSAQVAFILQDLMKSVVEDGTGSRAKIANMPVAGKTGTTSNNYDAWFVGYTPYYVGATWIGSDLPRELSTGSKMSAMLWSKIMSQVHSGLPAKQFDQPDGIIKVSICSVSGKLASSNCGGHVKSEVFASGTEPKSYCSLSHYVAPVEPVEEQPTDANGLSPNEAEWENQVEEWLDNGNTDNNSTTNNNGNGNGKGNNKPPQDNSAVPEGY
ncbi:MAG: penicillin-binding protein [Peptoclostridium sp.]|uniref:transglycosylase domain-containing protein n=1 Tax=Peptoclostridium sp. TaxID=1904860 RepID=UPI00139CFCE9|nr:transglycosylase domain-containing protein [Peptoclostridium sp.]MZQ76123.1 penicillin-binding protein [Peptoclostridium sp.]